MVVANDCDYSKRGDKSVLQMLWCMEMPLSVINNKYAVSVSIR